MLGIQMNVQRTSSAVLLNVESVYDDRVVPLSQLKSISDRYAVSIIDAANKYHIGVFTYSDFKTESFNAENEARSIFNAYLNTNLTAEEERLAFEIKALIDDLNHRLPVLFKKHESKAIDDYELIKESYDLIDNLSSPLTLLIDLQLDEAESDIKQIYSLIEDSITVGWIILTLAFLLLSLLSNFIVKKEIRNLPEIVSWLQDISEGILVTRKFKRSNNEFDMVTHSLVQLLDKLSVVIKSSTEIASNVASSSELTVVMRNTAKYTQSELVQMEEISTALCELSSTSEEVSSNADQEEDETRKARIMFSEGI